MWGLQPPQRRWLTDNLLWIANDCFSLSTWPLNNWDKKWKGTLTWDWRWRTISYCKGFLLFFKKKKGLNLLEGSPSCIWSLYGWENHKETCNWRLLMGHTGCGEKGWGKPGTNVPHRNYTQTHTLVISMQKNPISRSLKGGKGSHLSFTLDAPG